MTNRRLASGIVIALLAFSMDAGAHDIDCTNAPTACTYDTLVSVGAPVGEPCTDSTLGPILTVVLMVLAILPPPLGGPGGIIDTLLGPGGCLFDPPLAAGSTLFGLTICESDSFLGSGIATPGHGGLCSMSTGHAQGAGVCTFTGRSNGNGVGGDHDGDGACGGPSWPPTASEWYTFELTSGTPGDVTYCIGGICCAFDGTSATVDMMYVDAFAGGHVEAYQNVAGETGSYTVSTAAGPATDCSVGFVPLTYTP